MLLRKRAWNHPGRDGQPVAHPLARASPDAEESWSQVMLGTAVVSRWGGTTSVIVFDMERIGTGSPNARRPRLALNCGATTEGAQR